MITYNHLGMSKVKQDFLAFLEQAKYEEKEELQKRLSEEEREEAETIVYHLDGLIGLMPEHRAIFLLIKQNVLNKYC